METTRWHLSNDMYFILVYCCVGMLMTSCFGGCHSHFWTQKNHASATKIDNFHRYFSAQTDGIHFNLYMNSTLSVWAEKKRWKLSISFLVWTGNNRDWIIQSTVNLHEIRGTSQNSVYIFVSTCMDRVVGYVWAEFSVKGRAFRGPFCTDRVVWLPTAQQFTMLHFEHCSQNFFWRCQRTRARNTAGQETVTYHNTIVIYVFYPLKPIPGFFFIGISDFCSCCSIVENDCCHFCIFFSK